MASAAAARRAQLGLMLVRARSSADEIQSEGKRATVDVERHQLETCITLVIPVREDEAAQRWIRAHLGQRVEHHAHGAMLGDRGDTRESDFEPAAAASSDGATPVARNE